MTYKFGVALDSNMVPDYIRVAENKKKELLKVTCPILCCIVKGHVTNGTKNCRYNVTKKLGQLNSTVNDYLAKLYPENYGECCQYSYRISTPWCRQRCSNFIIVVSRGVTDSTFAFYERFFEEKVIFRFVFYSLSPSFPL